MQGEHRIPSAKVVPYEESIRVPLIICGPGVPVGKHVKAIAANIALAPTILDTTGSTAAITVDGRSLLPIANATATENRGIVIETGPKQSGNWYPGIRAPRWKYAPERTCSRVGWFQAGRR